MNKNNHTQARARLDTQARSQVVVHSTGFVHDYKTNVHLLTRYQ